MTEPADSPSSPTAPLPSLSTMWALQDRFERDLPAFMDRAAALGYRGIEINHAMSAEQIGAILVDGSLPVTGVHAPAPLERHPDAGWNRRLNLAATDEQERTLAVDYTLRSIEVAGECGARHVVVHLGGVGDRTLRGDRRLRSTYLQRDEAGEQWERTIGATVRERAAIAPPFLDQARRSLEALAQAAEARGVTLGLECRLYYHDIPLPQEAFDLLAPYPNMAAGYLHDVGHAEVLHRLGLVDRNEWFDVLGERLVGLHLHDVHELNDHRAPGTGDVDYAWLAARINAANPSAARTFEIDQHESDDDVARGLEVLRAAGVVP